MRMSLSKQETKQILERLIFDATAPQDWVQDVWALSPLHGDSAAKLLEAFEALAECCPTEKLEAIVETFTQESLD